MLSCPWKVFFPLVRIVLIFCIAGLLFFVPRARRTVLFEKTNRDVTVLLVASPAPEMLPGIDGIIGVNALHAHHIDFDFAGRTLSWN